MRMWKLVVATFLVVPLATCAQNETMRILVAAPPGGGTDTIFRILAKGAGAVLNEPIVAVNVPAANGIVAVEQMLHASANGKTLVGAPSSSITAVPHLFKAPWTPEDYIPILGISSSLTPCASRHRSLRRPARTS